MDGHVRLLERVLAVLGRLESGEDGGSTIAIFAMSASKPSTTPRQGTFMRKSRALAKTSSAWRCFDGRRDSQPRLARWKAWKSSTTFIRGALNFSAM